VFQEKEASTAGQHFHERPEFWHRDHQAAVISVVEKVWSSHESETAVHVDGGSITLSGQWKAAAAVVWGLCATAITQWSLTSLTMRTWPCSSSATSSAHDW